MSIGHLKVKHRARFQPQHGTASLQRFDFGIQGVFRPVDVFKLLLESEFRAPERFQLLLGARVS